jgi:hypothetical protein
LLNLAMFSLHTSLLRLYPKPHNAAQANHVVLRSA